MYKPCTYQYSYVKLNNPLMGTENRQLQVAFHLSQHFHIVKLNNPLMGTENPLSHNIYRFSFLFCS